MSHAIEAEPAITEECIIEKAVANPTGFILRITIQDQPVGAQTSRSVWPIRVDKVVTSEGRVGITSEGLDNFYGEPRNDSMFAFNTTPLPDGSHTFGVTVEHDFETREHWAWWTIPRPEETVQAACGSIAVRLHDRNIEQVPIVEP